MTITMPYEAFRSQNRVEFIKKKFESSFSSENDSESVKHNNSIVSFQSNFVQEFKDLNLNSKTANPKSEISDVNKNEGKALVKRSPAFRREKLGCTKSLNRIPFQKSSTFVELRHKNLNGNAQDTIFKKAQTTDINMWKDFKRSKTDTNLLKNCSDRVIEKGIFHKNSKISEISNSSVLSQNKDGECDTNEKTFDQCGLVNKIKNVLGKDEIINSDFSESIRRALQSPLPKGPPPKKPPRTFCHVQNLTQPHLLIDNDDALSGPAKSDIPRLKSKLEKLEKVAKIHESGILADQIINNSDKEVKKTSIKTDNCVSPIITETCHSCLPISQCLNQSTKVLNFKKVSKINSEFYLRVDKADLILSGFEKSKKSFVGSTSNQPKSTPSSSEVIYDLPCISVKNSFRTFGKSSKHLKNSVNTKTAEDLHYMCTDIINPSLKHPNFLANSEWRNSKEEENKTEIKDIKPNIKFSQKHSQINKNNDLKENLNDLKEEKVGERMKSKSCSALLEIKNDESEYDIKRANTSEEENSSLTPYEEQNKDLNEKKKKSDDEEKMLSYMSARRKIYVSRVSSKLMSQISCWKQKNQKSYKHLFECCLLVGLTLCESKQSVPYIKSIFPPDTKPPPLIESLCFPDASYWPLTLGNHYLEEQCYSLVVTNENGERKFGYCRRVLPEGGHVCLPLAYCIISPHRAGGFFHKVLEELESKHGSPVVESFIKQLYESEFPGPGERLKLRHILEEATRTSQIDSNVYLSSTLVRRPPDVRLEEKDLTQLLKLLQLPTLLKVFSALLHERKVLLLSNSLRNLSSCIEALQSILLPFSWQHTYIPVLPVHLIEMCEAPTPYMIGMLKPKNMEKSLTNIHFEDGILVDLDDSKVLKCCDDEGSILPSRPIKDLKTSLNLATNSSDLLSESVRSVLISDAFIRFFVQVCGNYSKFIKILPNGEKIFQKDDFVKSVSSNTLQLFLDWFTETAMFNSFIQERLQNDEEDVVLKLFRRRVMEYSEESVRDSAVLLRNYRVINKKVKNLGGKIKDFTSFTK